MPKSVFGLLTTPLGVSTIITGISISVALTPVSFTGISNVSPLNKSNDVILSNATTKSLTVTIVLSNAEAVASSGQSACVLSKLYSIIVPPAKEVASTVIALFDSPLAILTVSSSSVSTPLIFTLNGSVNSPIASLCDCTKISIFPSAATVSLSETNLTLSSFTTMTAESTSPAVTPSGNAPQVIFLVSPLL